MSDQKLEYTVRLATEKDLAGAAVAGVRAFNEFQISINARAEMTEDVFNAIVNFKLSIGGFGFVAVTDVDGKETVMGSVWAANNGGFTACGPFTVDTKYQKHGVATKLIRALMDECRSRGWNNLRLVQVAPNTPAFCLYAKLGFEAKLCISHFEGYPTDEAIKELKESKTWQELTIRKFTVEDVPAANKLFQKVNGPFDMGPHLVPYGEGRAGPFPTAAAFRGDELVGYATSVYFSGHIVAVDEEVVKAIYVFGAEAHRASKGPDGQPKLEPPSMHVAVGLYPALTRWALAAGLKLYRHCWLMSIGEYQQPDPSQGVYCPSIEA